MNHYEEKQAARKVRYEELAKKADQQSNAIDKEAKKMANVIPFGQPIHVGHHSERSDRHYRDKVSNTYKKSHELIDQAEYYRDKASSVGNAGISSDDPDVIPKLQEKLTKLEVLQEKMKKANKLAKHQDRSSLAELGFSEQEVEKLLKPGFCCAYGFAKFELTNNNANIRRIKLRIQELEKHKQRSDKKLQCNGYIYKEDVEDNRIWFIFPDKPDEATRIALKSHSFNWSPARKAWVRQLNGNGLGAAKQVKEILDNVSRN